MSERIIVCLEADPQCARKDAAELDAIAERVRAELAKPVAVIVLPVGHRAVVHRFEAEDAKPAERKAGAK